jgi:murein L,D-transpeptidase YcbB/YkuD
MVKFSLLFLFLFAAMAIDSCQQKKGIPVQTELPVHLQGTINQNGPIDFDSSTVATFFQSHPELAKYQPDVALIYRKYNFHTIWFDENGVVEFGQSLYGKVGQLEKEGVSAIFPYQDQVAGIFETEIVNSLGTADTDLMLTSLFLFYAEKVYKGVDEKTSAALEWLLPRKQLSYENLLDSIMLKPTLLDRDEKLLFRQYYKLREVLQKYRNIEKAGGWKTIGLDPKLKAYKPGDSCLAIRQIRDHLYLTGDLQENSGSNRYDSEMMTAVRKYQSRNGKTIQNNITPALIREMNIPVGERIRKIIVNMERCRWITPEVVNAKELVFVNIPSFKLVVFREGRNDFESPVVVGKSMTKTVIFSGNMSHIVFSPYWVLPESIIRSEVKPGMAKNPNYLESHNMEWNGGQIRQKPGKRNSLGLVKFIFPNSNNIYLHDTPSKSLFARENRAFSHGCIRVAKPGDLAVNLLKDDPAWTPEKIDAAMNAGKENWYTLKNKIPVYIGYFTAYVDLKGAVNFYEDVYKRDEQLYEILVK